MSFLTCPFHWLTGLQCPLCGLQRSLWALLHLHPVEAFWYNPWLVVLLPYVAVIFCASVSKRAAALPLTKWCMRNSAIITMLVLTILWGAIRNLL